MVCYPVIAKLLKIFPQENYFVTKSFMLLVCYNQSLLKLLSYLIHFIFPKTSSQAGFTFTSHIISSAHDHAILSVLHHLLSPALFSQW